MIEKGKRKRNENEKSGVRYVFDPQTGQYIPYTPPEERHEEPQTVRLPRTAPTGAVQGRKRRKRPISQRSRPSEKRSAPASVMTGVFAAKPSIWKRKPWLKKLYIGALLFFILVILINIAFLYYRGQIWFNEPRKRDYPVRGAVIDADLGEVDWEIMSTQTISFVYIRATKSTQDVDVQYENNRKGVNKTKLLAGYYHEFDFSRDGRKQANNFIDSLGDLDGKLRPMVKLTRYGIYKLKMKDREKVRDELEAFLQRIEEEYGRRCVIMCDKDCYEEYVEPYFSDYTLWYIDHFGKPKENVKWALWEFNPRVRSSGYENKKVYYAMTVYRRDKDLENFKKNFML